ncbi:MAG: NAD-dependent epimerase/dehydratase family protein [Deltaproteobacteria bacterium]|nr:MAG: NAD-dependent epimerase/dehydratase family protein [Deltaproteobacteria bacterium]
MGICADLHSPDFAQRLPEVELSAVVLCVAPSEGTPAGYQQTYLQGARSLVAALRLRRLRPRLLFVSSTSVYAQDHGERVDEQSPAAATHFRGATMLQAEACIADSGLPHSILRLGGIYGPERLRLLRRVQQGRPPWPPSPHYTNRVHRDDAAAMVVHLCRAATPLGLYLGVDCEAAEQRQVLLYLHALMGKDAEPPPLDDPTVRGKRCDSGKLLRCGHRFGYPTYREGYAELWRKLQHGLV